MFVADISYLRLILADFSPFLFHFARHSPLPNVCVGAYFLYSIVIICRSVDLSVIVSGPDNKAFFWYLVGYILYFFPVFCSSIASVTHVRCVCVYYIECSFAHMGLQIDFHTPLCVTSDFGDIFDPPLFEKDC